MNKTSICSTRSIRRELPKRGFVAVIAVLLISGATTALSLSVLGAAVSYSDSVFRREMRLQASFDALACEDTAKLIKAKDVFASGTIHLAEFNCDVSL